MTSADDSPRLEQALVTYVRWMNAGGTDPDRFLADHGELRDLLEPILADQDGEGERPERRLGEFRLIREVGRGGMGVVFEAEQRSLGRRVALKVLPPHLTLSPAAIARFRREAETAARVGGEGLVQVHTVGTEGDIHFYAMEFVEGAPLDAIVAELRARPFDSLDGAAIGAAVAARCHRRTGSTASVPSGAWRGGYFETTVRLVRQIAEALAHMHELGVVHRDVKPSNILVKEDGSAMLTDFGLARVATAPALTMTGDFVGTPHYVAPEQAAATGGDPRPAVDVFGLGATLYELITLRRAFDGRTSADVLQKIASHEPRDPQRINPALPEDLVAVTLKALDKDPARRYRDGAALASDLRAFLEFRPVSARRVSAGFRLWRWARRNRTLAATSLALALTLLVAAAWTVVQNRILRDTVAEMRRLSDGHLLTELTGAYAALPAARDGDAAALRAWYERAGEAVGRLPVHERTLAALRARAEPYLDADRERDRRAHGRWGEWEALGYRLDDLRGTSAAADRTDEQRDKIAALEAELAALDAEISVRRTWRFPERADQWAHDTLVNLVAGLGAFTDPVSGPFTKVGERLEVVPRLTELTIERHADAWARTIADIADPERSPWYRGLRITPQLGLVPLGRDPDTGFHEFGHPQTGALPARGDDGRLVLTDDFGLVFVLLPGGAFDMGARRPAPGEALPAANVDPAARPEEAPVHRVELDPFLIAKFEMTKAQWLRFTGRSDGQFRNSTMPQDKFTERDPIETVHWVDCQAVMQALGLALPTESQWEYAARGGTSGPRWCGDGIDAFAGAENVYDRTRMLSQSLGEADDPASWSLDDGAAHVTAVGRFRPNPFGLHDVLGNVSEWVADTPCAYPNAPAPGTGLRRGGYDGYRMQRGLNHNTQFASCRVSWRDIRSKWSNIGEIGVRPARELRVGD